MKFSRKIISIRNYCNEIRFKAKASFGWEGVEKMTMDKNIHSSNTSSKPSPKKMFLTNATYTVFCIKKMFWRKNHFLQFWITIICECIFAFFVESIAKTRMSKTVSSDYTLNTFHCWKSFASPQTMEIKRPKYMYKWSPHFHCLCRANLLWKLKIGKWHSRERAQVETTTHSF